MANTATKKTDEEVTRFSKNQLLTSKKYKDRYDLVSVLLKDGKEYTIEEVESEIQKYLKKEVH